MDLHAYLVALRKNWWIILVLSLVGLGGAVGLVARSTPIYAGSVTFFVNTTPGEGQGNLQSTDQYAQQRVSTYVLLASSERLAQMIADETGSELSADAISRRISATARQDTVILVATVQDASPERVAQLTTGLSTEFIALVSDIDPAVQMEVVSGPTVGSAPVSPRTNLYLALGLLLGFAIGVLAAVAREMLDVSVRSALDVKKVTDVPVLGRIWKDSAARKSPLVGENQSQTLRAEAFRQVRTGLQFVDIERPAQVIVVTSAGPGEGKSSVSVNLALTISRGGARVLLIEGDLRRPKASDYLGLEPAVGLTNVLAGEVNVNVALQRWADGNLYVLPSGSLPPNPSELLGGTQMIQLVEAFRQSFDVVVIDTPPVLPVTDAAVAAAHSDGAVVVVQHGKTSRRHLAEVIERLEAVDARLLGVVINAVPTRGSNSKTYGTYGLQDSTMDQNLASGSVTENREGSVHVDWSPSRPRKLRP